MRLAGLSVVVRGVQFALVHDRRENGAGDYGNGNMSGKTKYNRIDKNTNINNNHSENDGNNSISTMEKFKEQQDEKTTPPIRLNFPAATTTLVK
eukprot:697268-Ditylum_brightwellii.AAC.1